MEQRTSRQHGDGSALVAHVESAGATRRLLASTVLLHLGLASASIAAFGVADLLTPVHPAWIASLGVVAGVGAAYALWERARRSLASKRPLPDEHATHYRTMADVPLRTLAQPYAR